MNSSWLELLLSFKKKKFYYPSVLFTREGWESRRQLNRMRPRLQWCSCSCLTCRRDVRVKKIHLSFLTVHLCCKPYLWSWNNDHAKIRSALEIGLGALSCGRAHKRPPSSTMTHWEDLQAFYGWIAGWIKKRPNLPRTPVPILISPSFLWSSQIIFHPV